MHRGTPVYVSRTPGSPEFGIVKTHRHGKVGVVLIASAEVVIVPESQVHARENDYSECIIGWLAVAFSSALITMLIGWLLVR